MKNIIGVILVLLGLMVGLYSNSMPTLTTEQSTQSLSNAFDGLSGKKHDEIYNPELLNEKTNYFIISGFLFLSGVVTLLIPVKK